MTQQRLIAIIVLLIALIALSCAHFLAGSPSFWIWIGILFSIWTFDILFNVAWGLFFSKGKENAKE